MENIVEQFQHNVFGNLTVIKSQQEEGKLWFIGKEIQNILELTNLTMAIKNADLDNDETLEFTKKEHPKFWNYLINFNVDEDSKFNLVSSETPIFSKYSKSITFISESGLYGLVLNSRKPHAKEFKRWIRKEVLPRIRKKHEEKLKYKTLPYEMEIHLDEQIQKEYSKWYNHINMQSGGVNKIVASNIKISLDQSMI